MTVRLGCALALFLGLALVETYPLVRVDMSSYSHPFWTGAARVLDSAGQVEKFNRRYGRRR